MAMTSTASPETPSRPAHREPLVWLVVGIPALTVVAGLFTWWIAAQRADSDVADDHYKRGLAINRILEREQAAQRAGLGARIEVTDSRGLELRLKAAPGTSLPEALQVVLTHPVQASQDRRLLLVPAAGGVYRSMSTIEVTGFEGHWGLALEGEGWRLAGARLALQSGASAELGAWRP
ncbi:MAG: FixH family protein [Burkholderiaceae bacterium]